MLLSESGAPVQTALQGLQDCALDLVDITGPGEAPPRVSRENLQRYARLLGELAVALEGTDPAALRELCLILQDNVGLWMDEADGLTDAHCLLLQEFPVLIAAYGECPRDSDAVEALLEHLANPLWRASALEQRLVRLTEQLAPASDDSQACDEAEANGAGARSQDLGPIPDPESETAASGRASVGSAGFTELELEPQQQELVDLLRGELADVIEAQKGELPALSDSEAVTAFVEAQAQHVERIGAAAEMVGLEGLQRASEQIRDNLTVLHAGHPQHLGESMRGLLRQWPIALLGYLLKIHDRQVCGELVAYLSDEAWPAPLPEEDASALIDSLCSATVVAQDEDATPRPTQATPEDVSLVIPEDVNADLLESLLGELPGQTEAFSASIHRMLDGGFVSDVDVAQRIAHTLKGASNVVGVRGIATLTHHLEDILQALVKNNALPTAPQADTLIGAADCLEAMSEAVLGQGEPPPDAVAILQEVLDWANRIDRKGVPAPEPGDAQQALSGSERGRAGQPQDQGLGQVQGGGAAPPVSDLQTEAMLRIPARWADDLLRLAGETMISTGQIQEQLGRVTAQADALRQQGQQLVQLSAELEQLVDVRGMSSTWSRQRADGEFDVLELDQYNELHTVTHRLIEATTDALASTGSLAARLNQLGAMSADQGRLNRESQEAVMKTRMVPVSTVVPRLKRSVRQAARMTGKEAELQVRGADTLMDSDVLGKLMDPLMHILRNAVDHGIEGAQTRRELAKPAAGAIELVFVREGHHILVRCHDDGAGLDLAAIRNKAEANGLISPDAALTEEELSRLIFSPGFSTASEVTQVSGRGIGMDAVLSRVRDMKGTCGLRSRPGGGTVIELAIPVTLLSTHALLVRVARQVIALSNRGVEEILYADVGEVQHLGADLAYQVGDELYKARYLDDMLSLPADPSARGRPRSVLLVSEESGSRTAVLVQEILDTRDLVVKPPGRYEPSSRGIVGATILGDGSVAPVVDLTDLLYVPAQAPAARPVDDQPAQAARQLPLALVVDDSLSARRSLAQFVQDMGLEVQTAKDGIEAVAMMEDRPPDLLLVDLEMPRMNGLELTSHVRAKDETKDMAVIMITSRSTDKHRRQAKTVGVDAYMTKPFSEDELLERIQSILEAAC